MTTHWRHTEWKDGLKRFAERLRNGEITAEETTERALARIRQHDEKYQAFVHVAWDRALADAQRIDLALQDGTDLGPLMGVPVGIKDLFAVEGMPARAGSRLDFAAAMGTEGSFVARLRAAGAVILGKTRTIEFAAGAQNIIHPTPWNAADPERHRCPGGSSNGSAVAVAAGFCPVAIGSDTGGSVRAPAAMCGITGYKSTAGLFDLDGVFPLCPSLDSVGIFAAMPDDVALAARALMDGWTAEDATPPNPLRGLRIGKPSVHMLGEMTDPVQAAFEGALGQLKGIGAEIVTLDWPTPAQVIEIDRIFSFLVPADLLRTLGQDVLGTASDRVDPVALDRLSKARNLSEAERRGLNRGLAKLKQSAAECMSDLDILLYPTCPLEAPLVESVLTTEQAVAFNRRALGVTRAANAMGFTACSIPLSRPNDELPIGLDVAMKGGSDLVCLDLATALCRALRTPS